MELIISWLVINFPTLIASAFGGLLYVHRSSGISIKESLVVIVLSTGIGFFLSGFTVEFFEISYPNAQKAIALVLSFLGLYITGVIDGFFEYLKKEGPNIYKALLDFALRRK